MRPPRGAGRKTRTEGDPLAVSVLTTSRTPASPAPADAYTARHLSVLEGLDAVRKRPGMYIGSTDSRGLQHCLAEIVDNAVDEALAGHCNGIEVTLHADGSAEVRDNGRGIPVDVERKTKLTGVELVMTRLHAGYMASAPRSSTRWPRGWTSRWIGRDTPGRPASAAASPASSPRPARTRTSPGSRGCASSAARDKAAEYAGRPGPGS